MKTKLFLMTLAMTTSAVLVSCGGGSSSSSESDEVKTKTVKVEGNHAYNGAFSNSLELQSGDYKLSYRPEGYGDNAWIYLNFKVTNPSKETLDYGSTVILVDEAGSQVAVLSLSVDYDSSQKYELNKALENGTSSVAYKLYFEGELTEEEFEKVTSVLPGDSFGIARDSSDSTTSDDSAVDDSSSSDALSSSEIDTALDNLEKALKEFSEIDPELSITSAAKHTKLMGDIDKYTKELEASTSNMTSTQEKKFKKLKDSTSEAAAEKAIGILGF